MQVNADNKGIEYDGAEISDDIMAKTVGYDRRRQGC